MTEKKIMIEKAKKLEKNRIVINLTTLVFEIESSTEPLEKVFALADLIARNLGKKQGLDGVTWEERIKKAGIE